MGRKNRPVKIRKKSLPDVTRIQPPKRMDIWYAHLRENTGTSVQEGSRPVLVISNDITAFVLMFPPRVPEEKYIMLPFFWIPEDTIPQRVRRASVPYDVWYQQGYLMATEGNVIHYGFIEKVIEELGKTFHILEIAFDRWGAVQMTQNLEGMGFTVVPFGQGFKDMSPPTKEFYKLLMEGRIIHGGNPVMAWMAGNVVVDTDPAGNIKPTKAKSPEKIDGIVAAIMALDRCIRNEGQQQGSVYDERDMIVF